MKRNEGPTIEQTSKIIYELEMGLVLEFEIRRLYGVWHLTASMEVKIFTISAYIYRIQELNIKLMYSEKATKNWRNLPH